MRTNHPLRFLTRSSRFGPFAVLWSGGAGRPSVRRILLPRDGRAPRVEDLFPGAERGADRTVRELAGEIAAFLEGESIRFSLRSVALGSLSSFQRDTLRAEHGIPRGRVATYGDLAARIGAPRAARAVGRALATNPFPIVVPCHRAIRGDRSIGGFQGGAAMKRIFLEREGVEISPEGKAVRPRFHYR